MFLVQNGFSIGSLSASVQVLRLHRQISPRGRIEVMKFIKHSQMLK